MASPVLAIGAVGAGLVLLATVVCGATQVLAQQPKLPVNETCCHQEKPKCESTCPIMDEELRESCRRDCEGRLRECLAQSAFVPKHGQNVICVRR